MPKNEQEDSEKINQHKLMAMGKKTPQQKGGNKKK